MYAVFVWHVEIDPFNRYGASFEIPRERQTFMHIDPFYKTIKKIESHNELKFTFMVRCGSVIENKLLDYHQTIEYEGKSEFGIHYHTQEWNALAKRWIDSQDFDPNDFSSQVSHFSKVFRFNPTSIVFGDWIISPLRFMHALKNKIEVDGSLVSHSSFRPHLKFDLMNPYYATENSILPNTKGGKTLLEVPALCRTQKPLDVLLHPRSMKYIENLLDKLKDIKTPYPHVLHLTAHSFSLFRFKIRFKILKTKIKILNKLINLFIKNKIKIISLSEIKDVYDWNTTAQPLIFNDKAQAPILLNLKHKLDKFLP